MGSPVVNTVQAYRSGSMKAVRHCHVPGKAAYTSASTWRTREPSGPPRARIARSRSGRGAQPSAAAASVAKSRSGLALMAIVVLLGACTQRTTVVPPPPMLARPTIVREASLENSFVSVQVTVPRDVPGPRPVVISLLGAEETLLDAGFAVVTYRLHWELIRGLAPPQPPPSPNTAAVGVWLLAAPSPQTVGQGYFAIIASDAGMVPRIVDYLGTLREVDATRIGIAGSSTNGFVALEA